MSEKTKLFDDTAEQAILGAILYSAADCIDKVRLTGLKEDDFYKQVNRALYHSFLQMADDGMHIDIKTVMIHLQKVGLADEITPLFLSQLLEQAGPSDTYEQQIQGYARTIKDYSARRAMQQVARCLLADSQDMGKAVVAISGSVQERLTALTTADDGAGWQRMTDRMIDYLEYFNNRQCGLDTALKTGFVDLDRAIVGLGRGELVILAARPSMGKTALALNIMTNVCKQGGKVLFVSEETPKNKVYDRLISSIGEIDYKLLREGRLGEKGANKVIKLCESLKDFQLDIFDRRVSVAEMKARAQLTKAKFNGLDLIVVDHIQLTRGDGRYRDRVHEVGEIVHGLKDLATRLDVPVLALSQLSRASETREDKRPLLSDLRETGDIEQDADIVLGLYRPAYYTRDKTDRRVELGTLKAKDSELKVIPLVWYGETQRFKSATTRTE